MLSDFLITSKKSLFEMQFVLWNFNLLILGCVLLSWEKVIKLLQYFSICL